MSKLVITGSDLDKIRNTALQLQHRSEKLFGQGGAAKDRMMAEQTIKIVNDIESAIKSNMEVEVAA